MSDTQQTTPPVDPNESKALTFVLKILRKIGRLVIGSTAPPLYLKVLSWGFITWSMAMIFYFMFISIVIRIGSLNEINDPLASKYNFTYAIVHCFALLGAILMYRQKAFGFWIFGIATILMPFWELIIYHRMEMNWLILSISLISIGLYALHFFVFAAKKTESTPPSTPIDNSENQQ